MSLAEESPQQTLVARYGAAVERLRAAMLAGQQHEFHAALAVLQEQRSDDMTQELRGLADALHDHGAKSDLMESRAAFAEKRKPNFKGWNDPEDRYRLPTLDSVK